MDRRKERRIHGLSRRKLPLTGDEEPGRHQVSVTLTGEQLDKRSILFEKNRGDFDANPDKYADNFWFAGSLLIIGEIVE